MEQSYYVVYVSTDSLALSNKQITLNTWKKMGYKKQIIDCQCNTLKAFTRYYWQVILLNLDHKASVLSIAYLETGPISFFDWQGDWIIDTKDIAIKRAAVFQETILINHVIRSARLYGACGGLYEVALNGKKVGDYILDPMFTLYDRRNLYVIYDVRQQLTQDSDIIDLLLGNGWYSLQIPAVWFYEKAPWRLPPCFCLDLRITYSDGNTETINTDKSWKSHLSNITLNSIYTGEHVDARLPDTAWKKVIFGHAPSEHIVAQAMCSIRDCGKLRVIKKTRWRKEARLSC